MLAPQSDVFLFVSLYIPLGISRAGDRADYNSQACRQRLETLIDMFTPGVAQSSKRLFRPRHDMIAQASLLAYRRMSFRNDVWPFLVNMESTDRLTVRI